MGFKATFKAAVYVFAAVGFILVCGYIAVRLGWTNTSGIIDLQTESFLSDGKNVAGTTGTTTAPAWAKSAEWTTFEQAALKDKPDIDRAAEIAGVPSRLIVSELVAEQLRLFYSERELFKQIFEPLKVLGDQSQFSWGVMGIKQETARAIEDHLTDPSSPYYLGPAYEHALDFQTSDHDQERFQRIIDDKSRFYSYLYAGLYLKEIEEQWLRAGYDISGRPEVLGTLFNIGFEHSVPKADPQVGGSALDIGGTTYSFGGLAGAFYHSDQLLSEFPK